MIGELAEDPKAARFYRDAAAGAGERGERRAAAAGPQGRARQSVGGAAALAGRRRRRAWRIAGTSARPARRLCRAELFRARGFKPGEFRLAHGIGGDDARRARLCRAIVSIWFPNFAIDRWTRIVSRRGEAALADAPTVLVTEGAHGPRIDAANPPAAALGARSGARLADARMLDPALVAVPSDHMGDDATLAKMALAAQRWGPWSAPDRPDAILLDATGAAHLVGGEAAMLAEIEQRYAAQGYEARTAIAPTAGAAWALSHYGPDATVLLDPAAIPARSHCCRWRRCGSTTTFSCC